MSATLRSLPKEVRLLAALFAAAFWLWAVVLLVATIGYARLQKFDERVLLWLGNPTDLSVPIGPEWRLGTAREITLGSATVLLIMIFSAAGYPLLERRYGLASLVLVSTVRWRADQRPAQGLLRGAEVLPVAGVNSVIHRSTH